MTRWTLIDDCAAIAYAGSCKFAYAASALRSQRIPVLRPTSLYMSVAARAGNLILMFGIARLSATSYQGPSLRECLANRGSKTRMPPKRAEK